MQVLWDAVVAMPGGLLVLVSSLLFAMLTAVWLYRLDALPPSMRVGVGIALVCSALVIVLGPAIWLSTVAPPPYSNPGGPYIPMAVVFMGIPTALVCAIPALLVGLVIWAAHGFPAKGGEPRPDFRPALLTWLVLFVPALSFSVWLGVGLGMTG